MNRLLASIIGFLGMGLFVILLILSFFVFSYVFIAGAIVGLILFIVAFIRARFANKPLDESRGRTIEHDNDDINKRS